MAVRLKDVAESLGLSISTVSAVLCNRADFNEVTRKRVLQKVKDLNYRPNWLARSLATQKSHVIGVVVPNLSRSFFPNVLAGIDSIARNAGYHLVISNTDDVPAREEEEIATLVDRQVDGLIIASARPPGKNAGKIFLGASGVPFVLIDRFFDCARFVGSNDEHIGFMATQHLIEQGYRAIAHLGWRMVATGIGRHQGYVRALRESGMRVRRSFILEVAGEAGGYEGTRKLLQMRPRPDAIFAASDPVAIGAMRAIHECGLRSPLDFGVIGVGRVRYGEDLRVPLSTVDTHSTEIGKSAAAILLTMVRGKPAPAAPTFIEPTLIVRESSCRLPQTGDRSARARTRQRLTGHEPQPLAAMES
jgi:LacI family transcriptional regulator